MAPPKQREGGVTMAFVREEAWRRLTPHGSWTYSESCECPKLIGQGGHRHEAG